MTVSVIIRTKDSASTLSDVICSLRAQTVATEIIVVDSGSRDDTLAVARRSADRVLQMRATDFTFGRALNVGARVASAPIHAALSSHSFPPDAEWLERSLAHYQRVDVAGTAGQLRLPDATELMTTTHFQTLDDALAAPSWGFSNTGSTWRAQVWHRFPFNESLVACEDKEWALRVMAAGWTIAADPTLCVSDTHRRARGLRDLYRRTRREYFALGSVVAMEPYTLAEMFKEWRDDIPEWLPYPNWRIRLDRNRGAEICGKYAGLRATRGLGSTADGFAARNAREDGPPA